MDAPEPSSTTAHSTPKVSRPLAVARLAANLKTRLAGSFAAVSGAESVCLEDDDTGHQLIESAKVRALGGVRCTPLVCPASVVLHCGVGFGPCCALCWLWPATGFHTLVPAQCIYVLTASVPGLHPLQVVFKSAAAINGSIYQRLALLAPAVLLGPINLMAHMLPDKAFQQVLEARLMLSSASAALVRQARAAEAAKRACETAAAGADATAVVTAPVEAAAGAKASGGAGSRPRGSIAPGSFLGLLLSARDKAGHGLTDLQMLMQANTFTLAGVSKQVPCGFSRQFLLASLPPAVQSASLEPSCCSRPGSVTAAVLKVAGCSAALLSC